MRYLNKKLEGGEGAMLQISLVVSCVELGTYDCVTQKFLQVAPSHSGKRVQ